MKFSNLPQIIEHKVIFTKACGEQKVKIFKTAEKAKKEYDKYTNNRGTWKNIEVVKSIVHQLKIKHLLQLSMSEVEEYSGLLNCYATDYYKEKLEERYRELYYRIEEEPDEFKKEKLTNKRDKVGIVLGEYFA